jgi:anti-anti-sigma factor
LVLTGEIDAATADRLDRALSVAGKAHPREIYLDLGDVSFFSAAGLTFLVQARAATTAQDIRLTFGPMPPCVERAIALGQLGDIRG